MKATLQPVAFRLRRLFTAVLMASFVLALRLLLARQAPVQDEASESTCSERTQIRLFFGLGTPDGFLSEEEWGRFFSDVITPRFSRGVTVLHADGQWRRSDRVHVTKEPSRVVEIVHEDRRETDRLVQEIVAIYRRTYRQESVMLTRDRIEVCF